MQKLVEFESSRKLDFEDRLRRLRWAHQPQGAFLAGQPDQQNRESRTTRQLDSAGPWLEPAASHLRHRSSVAAAGTPTEQQLDLVSGRARQPKEAEVFQPHLQQSNNA